MGWFSKKKKKNIKSEILNSSEEEVTASIKYYVDEDDEMYMHINGFASMLEEYKKHCIEPSQINLLTLIIDELKKAKPTKS